MPYLLNIISSSDKRKRILLLLQHGPKTLGDFKSTLSFTSTGMLPQIRILEEQNLVKRENKKYALTEIGQVVAKHLGSLVKTVEVIEQHKEFLDNVLDSKKVMGISPIVHPIYPEFFLQLVERGTEVSLILTRKAFNKIEKEYNDMLARGLSFKNASFYISDEDIKLACIATDVFFSISLFFKNGVFDSSKDLVGFDKPALLWGEELFNYYKERSVKIESL